MRKLAERARERAEPTEATKSEATKGEAAAE
jgi:hypothetical protein